MALRVSVKPKPVRARAEWHADLLTLPPLSLGSPVVQPSALLSGQWPRTWDGHNIHFARPHGALGRWNTTGDRLFLGDRLHLVFLEISLEKGFEIICKTFPRALHGHIVIYARGLQRQHAVPDLHLVWPAYISCSCASWSHKLIRKHVNEAWLKLRQRTCMLRPGNISRARFGHPRAVHIHEHLLT